MYVNSARQRLASAYSNMWHRNLMRSGMVTALLLGLLVAGLAFAYRERGRGHLHRLEAKIVTERQDVAVPKPGGQEAVVLTRSRLAGGPTPEFLSVTMLPGRGMNILQITASIPGTGDVDLLDSQTVEQANAAMNLQGADANGAASLAMGAAFEAPWAGRIWGMPLDGHIATSWRGHNISLPANGATAGISSNGLMLAARSAASTTAAMPDGAQTVATFESEDFGAHWPSKTQMKVTVLLASRSIELTVTARNVGDAPEPIGIGWRPRFALIGDRSQLLLRIPGQMRLAKDRQSGMPTGGLEPVAGTAYDFNAQGGSRLGTTELDDTFVRLHQDFLDSGPIAEIRDPSHNFGLRLIALTPSIKAMHVFTKAKERYLSVDPQFNYDDPLGHEWGKDTDSGMVVLQPGQTAQWQVRLELFSLTGQPGSF